MRNSKILLVEDSTSTHTLVRSILNGYGHFTACRNLEEARMCLTDESYDLLLLDVQLPDGCGFDFCHTLREDPSLEGLAIIFLTGSKTEIDDRVKGFELGADDYILKPIEPKEFLARVESKLKRKPKVRQPLTILTRSKFRLDLISQTAFIKEPCGNERRLDFTPIEFKLFSYFLRHEGQVFSREALIKAIWGENIYVARHTLDTHISALRKKMGTYGTYLRAVVKKGYCLELPA